MVIRKTVENSPSLALNQPSPGDLSPELALQLHSGYLRLNSSHLSPYIPEVNRSLRSYSGRSIVNVDLSASDIGVPVNSLSTKSNSLHSDERIVFDNAANMIRYHAWFVNPFVKPAKNNTLLDSY